MKLILILTTLSALSCGNHAQSSAEDLVSDMTLSYSSPCKSVKRIIKDSKVPKTHNTMILVDYSIPIHKKRFFVCDIKDQKLVYSTYVGHAAASGADIPYDFSNTRATRKTSLGLYKVGNTYFGKFGKSKKLHGKSKENSNAFKRAIVAHSLPGASPEDLYSWGCFTFYEKDLSKAFSYMIKGSYLLAFN